MQVQLCLVKAIFNVTEAIHMQNIRQDQNIFCRDQVKIPTHTPPPPNNNNNFAELKTEKYLRSYTGNYRSNWVDDTS